MVERSMWRYAKDGSCHRGIASDGRESRSRCPTEPAGLQPSACIPDDPDDHRGDDRGAAVPVPAHVLLVHGAMPRKPAPKPDNPEQFKRFLKTARDAGAEESGEAFDCVLDSAPPCSRERMVAARHWRRRDASTRWA